jgi:hypothetical protein
MQKGKVVPSSRFKGRMKRGRFLIGAVPVAAPDVYAVVAYLLAKNALIPERATMNAASLPAVRMSRVNDFVPAR